MADTQKTEGGGLDQASTRSCFSQTNLDSLQEKVNALKRLQSETEKEIELLTQCILIMAFKGKL